MDFSSHAQLVIKNNRILQKGRRNNLFSKQNMHSNLTQENYIHKDYLEGIEIENKKYFKNKFNAAQRTNFFSRLLTLITFSGIIFIIYLLSVN